MLTSRKGACKVKPNVVDVHCLEVSEPTVFHDNFCSHQTLNCARPSKHHNVASSDVYISPLEMSHPSTSKVLQASASGVAMNNQSSAQGLSIPARINASEMVGCLPQTRDENAKTMGYNREVHISAHANRIKSVWPEPTTAALEKFPVFL